MITVNDVVSEHTDTIYKNKAIAPQKNIFLETNGVHLNIIIPKYLISDDLLQGLTTNVHDRYISFGWGDENFYLNTPTLTDLKANNAINALFFKSSTLMHVNQYQSKQQDWIKVPITDRKLVKMNAYIAKSFQKDAMNQKVLLQNKGYWATDNFYRANGSYSVVNTCNTWVNRGFKESGLKACLWTPFDKGLLNKYD